MVFCKGWGATLTERDLLSAGEGAGSVRIAAAGRRRPCEAAKGIRKTLVRKSGERCESFVGDCAKMGKLPAKAKQLTRKWANRKCITSDKRFDYCSTELGLGKATLHVMGTE